MINNPTTHAFTLAIGSLLAASATAQCCLGAQHHDATSACGRYKVEARSQNGTGPGTHGPYHYRYRYLEKSADGEWRERASFERRYDVRHHFWMKVHVPSTGNGFLLDTSIDRRLVLFSPAGHELAEVRPRQGEWFRIDAVSPDGQFVGLVVTADQGGVRRWSTRTRLFVPLLWPVGPEQRWHPDPEPVRERRRRVRGEWQPAQPGELRFPRDANAETWLRRMLHWRSQRAPSAETAALIRSLSSDDSAAYRRAGDALVGIGLDARRPLRDAVATAANDAVRARLDAVLRRIDARIGGHEHPHRNLDLLCGLLEHPNIELATDARNRLRRVLPKGWGPDPALVHKHRDRLVWDAEAGAFELRDG